MGTICKSDHDLADESSGPVHFNCGFGLSKEMVVLSLNRFRDSKWDLVPQINSFAALISTRNAFS